jgi:uncharacterized protein YndB with AHSA1/START domain
MTKTITVDYHLPKPPRVVWRALTEAKLLAAWLMPNDIQPVVGHQFTFKAPPIPEWDGIVHCTILEVDAPRRLRYSWRGGAGANAIDTELAFTLEPHGATGTLLHLEHSGFSPSATMAFEGIKKGWTDHLEQRIAKVLEPLD